MEHYSMDDLPREIRGEIEVYFTSTDRAMLALTSKANLDRYELDTPALIDQLHYCAGFGYFGLFKYLLQRYRWVDEGLDDCHDFIETYSWEEFLRLIAPALQTAQKDFILDCFDFFTEFYEILQRRVYDVAPGLLKHVVQSGSDDFLAYFLSLLPESAAVQFFSEISLYALSFGYEKMFVDCYRTRDRVGHERFVEAVADAARFTDMKVFLEVAPFHYDEFSELYKNVNYFLEMVRLENEPLLRALAKYASPQCLQALTVHAIKTFKSRSFMKAYLEISRGSVSEQILTDCINEKNLSAIEFVLGNLKSSRSLKEILVSPSLLYSSLDCMKRAKELGIELSLSKALIDRQIVNKGDPEAIAFLILNDRLVTPDVGLRHVMDVSYAAAEKSGRIAQILIKKNILKTIDVLPELIISRNYRPIHRLLRMGVHVDYGHIYPYLLHLLRDIRPSLEILGMFEWLYDVGFLPNQEDLAEYYFRVKKHWGHGDSRNSQRTWATLDRIVEICGITDFDAFLREVDNFKTTKYDGYLSEESWSDE